MSPGRFFLPPFPLGCPIPQSHRPFLLDFVLSFVCPLPFFTHRCLSADSNLSNDVYLVTEQFLRRVVIREGEAPVSLSTLVSSW